MSHFNHFTLSHYSIFVQLTDSESRSMIVHGYTGAIDILQKDVAKYLQSETLFSIENFPFSDETFHTLVKRGYLTQKNKEEEREYTQKLAHVLQKRNKATHRSWMFVVSYDCNMRCPYCCETTISGGGDNWTKKTITKNLVNRGFDAMMQIEPNRELHANVITLYGGEPLLCENQNIVRYIIEKGHERGYKFHAVTNGYDLDHYLDVLVPKYFSAIQITLDGPREIHDQRRKHYVAGKTYDKILSNLEIVLKNGLHVGIRYNTDETNFEGIKTVKQELEDAGLFNYNLYINSSLVTETPGADREQRVKYISRKEFVRKHDQTDLSIDCQDAAMGRKIYQAMVDGSPMRLSPSFCSALFVTGFIFDPYGYVYSCWDVVGNQKFALGRYKNKISFNDNLLKWSERHIGNLPSCRNCKYALICGGGCVGKVLLNSDDIFKTDCDSFKDSFKMAANRAYLQYKNNAPGSRK